MKKYVAKQPDSQGNVAYSEEENETWSILYKRQTEIVASRACEEYTQGLSLIDLPTDRVPQCPEVSRALNKTTGWAVEPVAAIIPLKEFMIKEKINQVDLIKIDTEGFEYNTLLGLGDYIKKMKFILFEHHYDNMIIKNYKFADINKLLRDNGFKKIFKTKMPFRKSFDYIYENKN